jgi:hypothetical protein
MPLKKQPLNDNEIPIYDEALIYQRGEYWQMRMWLTKERKYARFSLRTRNRDTAIDKAKKHYHELMAQQLSGKTYFSMTTKQAVEEYVKQRQKDMDLDGHFKFPYLWPVKFPCQDVRFNYASFNLIREAASFIL